MFSKSLKLFSLAWVFVNVDGVVVQQILQFDEWIMNDYDYEYDYPFAF